MYFSSLGRALKCKLSSDKRYTRLLRWPSKDNLVTSRRVYQNPREHASLQTQNFFRQGQANEVDLLRKPQLLGWLGALPVRKHQHSYRRNCFCLSNTHIYIQPPQMPLSALSQHRMELWQTAYTSGTSSSVKSSSERSLLNPAPTVTMRAKVSHLVLKV